MWAVAAVVISAIWAFVGLAVIKAAIAIKVNTSLTDVIKKLSAMEDEHARFKERIGRLEMKR